MLFEENIRRKIKESQKVHIANRKKYRRNIRVIGW